MTAFIFMNSIFVLAKRLFTLTLEKIGTEDGIVISDVLCNIISINS